MREYSGVLQTANLFRDIAAAELTAVRNCLQAQTVNYANGAYRLIAGDRPHSIGIVLTGQLHIVRENMEGNPVSVVADSDVTVLHLYRSRILHTCPHSCPHHHNLLGNMLRWWRKRMDTCSIASSLCAQGRFGQGLGCFVGFGKRGDSFAIPLNREEMADYLCVERGALSHKWMRIKREGLIDKKKDWFHIR